jgi:phage N-6-adenine-methyltransferase
MLRPLEHPSERWGTPPEVWAPLHARFNFDLDAAADAEMHRVPNYLTDALNTKVWPGSRIWCNPPYGRKLEPFVRACARQAMLPKLVVMLIPFRCRAAWWHECVIDNAIEVMCVRKRISFMRPDGTRGDFVGSCDSCVVVWDGRDPTRPFAPTILTTFDQTYPSTNHQP